MIPTESYDRHNIWNHMNLNIHIELDQLFQPLLRTVTAPWRISRPSGWPSWGAWSAPPPRCRCGRAAEQTRSQATAKSSVGLWLTLGLGLGLLGRVGWLFGAKEQCHNVQPEKSSKWVASFEQTWADVCFLAQRILQSQAEAHWSTSSWDVFWLLSYSGSYINRPPPVPRKVAYQSYPSHE